MAMALWSCRYVFQLHTVGIIMLIHDDIIALLISLQRKRHRQTSNISGTLVGNMIVDNSDVVGASPVGAAPTTSSLST